MSRKWVCILLEFYAHWPGHVNNCYHLSEKTFFVLWKIKEFCDIMFSIRCKNIFQSAIWEKANLNNEDN